MVEIAIFREDHLTMRWTIVDANSTGVDVTSAKLTFSVKKNFKDASYSFQRKNTAAGGGNTEIEHITGISGIVDVKIIPSNTSGLVVGVYQYDLEAVIDSATGTVAQDKLIIKYDVT